MLKTRTKEEQYYTCDKCGKELTQYRKVNQMELCSNCYELWKEEWNKKQDNFLQANPNIKEDFLK